MASLLNMVTGGNPTNEYDDIGCQVPSRNYSRVSPDNSLSNADIEEDIHSYNSSTITSPSYGDIRGLSYNANLSYDDSLNTYDQQQSQHLSQPRKEKKDKRERKEKREKKNRGDKYNPQSERENDRYEKNEARGNILKIEDDFYNQSSPKSHQQSHQQSHSLLETGSSYNSIKDTNYSTYSSYTNDDYDAIDHEKNSMGRSKNHTTFTSFHNSSNNSTSQDVLYKSNSDVLEEILQLLPAPEGVSLWLHVNGFDENVIQNLADFSALDLFEVTKEQLIQLIGQSAAIRLQIRIKQLAILLRGNEDDENIISSYDINNNLSLSEREMAIQSMLTHFKIRQNQKRDDQSGNNNYNSHSVNAYNMNNMKSARVVSAKSNGSSTMIDLFTSDSQPSSSYKNCDNIKSDYNDDFTNTVNSKDIRKNMSCYQGKTQCEILDCNQIGDFQCAGEKCAKSLCRHHSTKDLLLSYYYCEVCFSKLTYAPVCREDLYQTFCSIQ